MLDQQRDSWLEGNPAAVEELLRGSPFEDDPDALLDLVYNEIVVQEEMGLDPSLETYIARYPHLEADLRLHFEVHKAFQEPALLDTPDHRYDDSWPQADPYETTADPELPDYQLVRVLGHGGMATVYLARHRRLHRDVALKMFKAGRSVTAREVFRIRTEAEAMARLAHPNILHIYEIGESLGAPYLALEYAAQGTLAQKLQKSPLPAHAAAELIETLARALQVAHQRHIVHRDLKPANILFAHDGTPKIADFGLAKVQQDSQVSYVEATRTGESMGTPRYMAPEQAAGHTEHVGPATDIYALGNLLYECLTGRAPFLSSSVVETARMICNDDPLPPRRLQPEIPRDLETICLRCLEKDPVRRYSSALALADDLRRYSRGEPILARPTPPWERGIKWCRRRPAHALLIALAMFGSLSLLFGVMFANHVESQRLETLRKQVAQRMQEGRQALDRDELEIAQSLFQEAWLKVQAEPELSDHEASVAGWLDHTRNALNRYTWTQRVPPREYDERRDAALLLSVLVMPDRQDNLAAAREAVRSAREFTLPFDPAWQLEREQLLLVETALISRESGPAAALAELKTTTEFSSHAYFSCRAELLEQLGRSDEARAAQTKASEYPPRKVASRFRLGMEHLRRREFDVAVTDFQFVLDVEPEHFAARLFQAIGCLYLDRPGEARVALTACLAQRPRFAEIHFFLALALRDLGEWSAAKSEIELVLHDRHGEVVRYAALMELGRWQWRDGRYDESCRQFEQATKEFPEEPAAWTHLGWAQLFRGDAAAAVSRFAAVLDKSPHDLESLLGSGCALVMVGEPLAAEQHFNVLRHQLVAALPIWCCVPFHDARVGVPILHDGRAPSR